MTPDERQLLTGLFERIRAAAASPRDREAEALISDAVRAQPYAPYLLAQTVIVQEQTMTAAASHIEELEARVKELEAASAGSGSFLGGLGKSIFGGAPSQAGAPPAQPAPSPWGRPAQQPPAQPGYAASAPQAAPWQQAPAQQAAAGGGFLKGALGTAAGVAGGVMLAHSLSGLFGGHRNNDSYGIGSGFDPMPQGGGSGFEPSQAAYQGNDGYQGQSIDDGLPSADNASYDQDSGGSYDSDTTDV